MCSSGDATINAQEVAQANLTNEMAANYATVFGQSQAITKQLTSTLTSQLQNPQGIQPAELAAERTAIKEGTAANYAGASRAANAVAAAHGGSALPSGVSAQVGGQIATAGAQQEAAGNTALDVANAQAKTQNYWNAVSGLSSTAGLVNANTYGNTETGSANATGNLGQVALSAKQAGWQDFGAILGGVGALATGAGAIGTGFKL